MPIPIDELYDSIDELDDHLEVAEDKVLHDYSFRVPAAPMGKGPLYMGVELELVIVQLYQRNLYRLAKAIEPWAWLKADGSLPSNGVEVVTAPMSLLEHHRRWAAFPRSEAYASHSFDECGLHVHLTKAALSPLQIAKLAGHINSPENRRAMVAIAGRANCEPAKFSPKKLGAYTYSDDRYEAVNLYGSNTRGRTIELRLYKGTLNIATLLGRIEHAYALAQWCAPASRSIAETQSFSAFRQWVLNRPQRASYPSLVNLLQRIPKDI